MAVERAEFERLAKLESQEKRRLNDLNLGNIENDGVRAAYTRVEIAKAHVAWQSVKTELTKLEQRAAVEGFGPAV